MRTRIVTGFFCILLTLLFLLPLPAQAASSAATRAIDDVQKAVKDYAGQDLREEQFADAKLADANFSGADMTGVVFQGSDLTGANFQDADLTYGIAYLSDFSKANFKNAILTEALFSQSIFCGKEGITTCAKIEGADFSYAIIDREQVTLLCRIATGVNPNTGMDTMASLGC